MKNLYKILAFTLLISFPLQAQDILNGEVLEVLPNKAKSPILGVNVFWQNTQIGTITDIDGKFKIPYKKDYKNLIISYVGYNTDTITIEDPSVIITHFLNPKNNLEEVVVKTKKQSTAKSYIRAQNVTMVDSKELLKAACCNLSESFETNPSIDVNFADAISGTRQIKMLGLTSPYILFTTENIPAIRGASQAYGLSFIPGTWVESIQITKGAGSVVNGFESIAGQINTELVKPNTDNTFFINAYGAVNGRLELNTHYNTKVSDKWHTGIYLHGNLRSRKIDNNNDNFLDTPLQEQINILNRWQYTNAEKGLVSFINFRYLNDQKQTGQEKFNPNTDKGTTNFWGSEIDTQRLETSAKLGYVNPDLPYQTIGIQTAFSNHQQDSYFGLKQYNITHNSFYLNGIYNSIIGDSRSKFKTGVNYTYDDYKEIVSENNFNRVENSIGAFFEYSFDNLDNINLTAGARIDFHNLLGTFFTPRFHIRYTPWEKSALRASFGRGKRSANIFAENQNIFASSRNINILNTKGKIYGLNPEIAWNYGVSFLQGFNIFSRKADLTLDFYKTDFTEQVIIDYENPNELNFYNLKGRSYANSFQAEFNYNLIEHLDLRFAYKYYDIKTDYNSGRLEKPLTPRNRIFINSSYEIVNHKKNFLSWKLDATYNWLSKQRFPSTKTNPSEYQLPIYSPNINTFNAQVTKIFSSTFEIYLGGENITNTKQKNPILDPESPFGSNFDTTFVYGPIFGANYYAGLRYKIK